MKKTVIPIWRSLTALLCSLNLAAAANFYPISDVSSTSTDFYPVSNLRQGPGSGFVATEPHDQLGGGATHTWVTDAPNGGGDYYANGVPDPVLVFDLGADHLLSEMSTWGYADSNTNGTKNFSLRFATSAEGASGFGNSITYNPSFAAAFPTAGRDSHAFSQNITARYVEMSISDNWRGQQDGTPGGDRVGLGEVAFEDSAPVVDLKIDLPPNFDLSLDGSVQTFDIPVRNLGMTKILSISSLSFAGADAGAFSELSLPAPIAPGGNRIIQISFNPAGKSGDIFADLIVLSNDPESPSVIVSITGFLHDPKLVVADNFDFGAFDSGVTGSQPGSLAISNSGSGKTLSISNTSIVGADADHFTVTSPPDGLAPSATEMIGLTFNPLGEEGIFSAQLTITSNDAADPTTIVNLTALAGDLIPNSSVRINEFMASNGETLNDGNGNSSDWIEIYNAGPGPADISGWYLTDSAGNLSKWRFPATTIPENDFLVVFASGQSDDGFVDPSGSLHTNFKLTTGGEYLALVNDDATTIVTEFAPAFPAQFTDISYGTFRSGGSVVNLIGSSAAGVLIPTDGSLGNTWQLDSFAPSASWISGTGQGVGYDNGSGYLPFITTSVLTDMRGNGTSAFIRLPFDLTDASTITALSFTFRYDDGFVAYLNGTEIANRNVPANPAWDDVANSNISESANFETIDVSAFLTDLQNGGNVLAIHGLNRSSGSSDFLIDVELQATLAGSGPLSLGYLNAPTPDLPNSSGATPGPEITSTSYSPARPTSTQSIVVNAEIAPRLEAISSASLIYRVGYGNETTIPMAHLGGGSYTATIPASAYDVGDMIRWSVSADDTGNNTGRAPVFLDDTGNNQSPEYFGTVTQDPSAISELPTFEWFTQSRSASHSRTGARASVYFDGRFYDNIYVRQRGQATNGSDSQKFDFNKADPFFANAEMPAVGEININGRGADSTYVRQTLSFDAHREAGVASCLSELWQLRVNGGSDRVGVFIEQVGEDFLKRNNYDPDGDLYKMVQRSNLNPVFFDIITGIEKKTNDKTDLSTLGDFVDGLNLPTSAQRRAYVIDNIDLPQMLNYLAARSIIQDADDLRKNFYVYSDIHGDCRWRIYPWDKDFTFGVRGDGGTHLPHPFFGDEEHKKQNANQWNILFDVLFEETTTQRLYLRRLRTLMDDLLQPSSTPSAQRYFENRADEIIDPASPPLSSNINSIDSYLSSRRNVLFNNYPSLIPDSQPLNPDITIAAVEYNPASGNQDEEYIRVSNGESTEIDISGWTISGGVDFTFAPGTVIERNGDLYICPDTKAFINRSSSPTGDEFHLAVGPYSGHLSNFGETLSLSDADAFIVDIFTSSVDPSDEQLFLVVSEIMYHPADPTPDAEFIELMNTSNTVTLDLGNVKFTAGIDYTFPRGTMLPPGARIVVSFSDFQSSSRLNNGSDRVKLEDASNSTIRDFTYNDNAPWPIEADGVGFSLILIAPASTPDHGDPSNWRSSTTVGGNPGTSDSDTFTGKPTDDIDNDGITALLEHALGTSDGNPDPQPLTISTNGGQLTVSIQTNHGADDIALTLEFSTDLLGWNAAPQDLFSVTIINNGDGTETRTYESSPTFLDEYQRQFLRIHAELLP